MLVEIVTICRRTGGLPENLSVASPEHISKIPIIGLISDLYIIRSRRASMPKASDNVPTLRFD